MTGTRGFTPIASYSSRISGVFQATSAATMFASTSPIIGEDGSPPSMSLSALKAGNCAGS
jgi:hypothetical protein